MYRNDTSPYYLLKNFTKINAEKRNNNLWPTPQIRCKTEKSNVAPPVLFKFKYLIGLINKLSDCNYISLRHEANYINVLFEFTINFSYIFKNFENIEKTAILKIMPTTSSANNINNGNQSSVLGWFSLNSWISMIDKTIAVTQPIAPIIPTITFSAFVVSLMN